MGVTPRIIQSILDGDQTTLVNRNPASALSLHHPSCHLKLVLRACFKFVHPRAILSAAITRAVYNFYFFDLEAKKTGVVGNLAWIAALVGVSLSRRAPFPEQSESSPEL